MAMLSIPRNDELSDESAATLAAEIARLETLLAAFPEENPRFLATEVRLSPLQEYLREDDGERGGELALFRAKARLAAHDTRVSRRLLVTRTPPWLTAVLLSLIFPILLAILASFVNSNRQLALYREQTSHDAMRKQADLLLVQLSSIVVDATQLRDDVAFEEGSKPHEGQAEALKGTARRLHNDFAATVRLHAFDAYPELQKSQFRAYYEISALIDCLDRRVGREPSDEWRNAEKDQEVLRDATSDVPCTGNFDVNAFERFKDAVKQNVDQRIGGALFPSKPATN